MNLRFCNCYGAGDLFESKAFVLEWMKLAGVDSAQYACKPQFWGIFEDVPQIRCVPLSPKDGVVGIYWSGGKTLHVNTWVGQKGYRGESGSYVLHPGTGCVIEKIYKLHNVLLLEAGLKLLPGGIANYLPTVDYARVPIAPSLTRYLAQNADRKLVLVCNGKTTSLHALNFDYHPMLEYLPESDAVRYLFTERVPIPPGRRDVTFTDDLTGRLTDPIHPGFDLNAISFLSRFCAVLVGRCSGPHVFCQVRENWLDPNKTLVCFTHYRNGACFVRYPHELGLKMQVCWSNETQTRGAADVLKGVIGR